jgi:RNA polymerase sigma-70 factor (family 1)
MPAYNIKSAEDNDLFLLVRSNNEKAFAEIYKRYNKTLYKLALFYLKDSEMAKDIVQDAFLRLWESRLSIYIQTSLGNYLYTVTKNIILKTIQEKNKEILQYYQIKLDLTMTGNELQEKMHSERKTMDLYKAIEKLPEQKKEVCLLKLNQNLNNQEIAERLGISIQTVKNHYNQCLRILKFYLHNDFTMLFPMILIIYIYSLFIK